MDIKLARASRKWLLAKIVAIVFCATVAAVIALNFLEKNYSGLITIIGLEIGFLAAYCGFNVYQKRVLKK